MSLSRIFALPFLFCVSTVAAQQAGAAGEVPDTRPLSREEALKSFQVAPGYRVELATSESLVGDPVLVQFGPDGRL